MRSRCTSAISMKKWNGTVDAYHQSVNARVNESEHPNRRRHVANTSPQAKHGAGMMKSLQQCALFSFGQDDPCVEGFVHFREIEEEAIICEALIPKPTNIRGIWFRSEELKAMVIETPACGIHIIFRSAAEATGAVDLAKGVCHSSDAVLAIPSRP